jgi:hypothetical protein
MLREAPGVGLPRDDVADNARPVTPVISLITVESWRFI